MHQGGTSQSAAMVVVSAGTTPFRCQGRATQPRMSPQLAFVFATLHWRNNSFQLSFSERRMSNGCTVLTGVMTVEHEPEGQAVESAAGPPQRTWSRRAGRAVVIYAVVPYLALAVMLGVFQRKLIYLPTTEATLTPADAGLPAGRVHTVDITTDDGLTLHGWHLLPPGRTAGSQQECDHELAEGRWLVIYFHGNAGNRRRRVKDCTDFTDLGADVFLFDYRGYGDNPGSPSEEKLAADAQTIWKYATEKRHVAPERILIYGESLGGGLATRLASEVSLDGTPPAGLILSSTFSSLVDAASFHYPWFPVSLMLTERYPSIERIRNVTCPILHIHGTRDTIVPIELGRHLFAAAPEKSAAGVKKRFLELPGYGHNDIAKSTFHDAIQTMLDAIDAAKKGTADERG